MPDRFNAFAERARTVLRLAQEEAQRFNHNYIGTEHLLLGLVRDQATVAGRVLLSLGVELNKVRNAIEFIIGRGDRPVAGDIGLTPRAKKVIELAVDEAERLGDQAVGSEHLLLGLVREGEGIGAGLLEELGIGLDQVRSAVVAGLATPGTVRLPAPLRAEPLTRRARAAIEQALLVARWYFHPQVDTEHLLLGLLRERGGIAAEALRPLGVDLARAQEQFEARAQARSSEAGAPIGFSLAALAAIERAGWEARQRGHRPAGTGHLLLGLLSVPEGHAAPLLERLGIGAEAVRSVIEPLLARDEA
jgi:ATP-dependent Clp protease ATP-binding subunit ClpA